MTLPVTTTGSSLPVTTTGSSLEALRTYDDLRRFVHEALCAKENLLAEQFPLSETPLVRRGKLCGLQFSLHGPRDVRLGAVWASDHNVLYLYDARGNRYDTVRLTARLVAEVEPTARRDVA